MPLFNAQRLKGAASVFIHEGAKAAGFVQWMVDAKSREALSGLGAGAGQPREALDFPSTIWLRGTERRQVAAVADERFRPFIALCAFAGLRLGEAAGVQLGDVDFLRRSLKVSRQVHDHRPVSNLQTADLYPPIVGLHLSLFPHLESVVINEG